MGRREAINEALIARKGVHPENLRYTVFAGVKGGGKAGGTVSYPRAFAGTPVVVLTKISGTTLWGRTRELSVVSQYPGSFTYLGTPGAGGGSFGWLAYGSA